MEAIFTCEDVAARYGVKLITVWDWIRKKKLNALRIGKRYYITEADINAFEQHSRTPATADVPLKEDNS